MIKTLHAHTFAIREIIRDQIIWCCVTELLLRANWHRSSIWTLLDLDGGKSFISIIRNTCFNPAFSSPPPPPCSKWLPCKWSIVISRWKVNEGGGGERGRRSWTAARQLDETQVCTSTDARGRASQQARKRTSAATLKPPTLQINIIPHLLLCVLYSS